MALQQRYRTIIVSVEWLYFHVVRLITNFRVLPFVFFDKTRAQRFRKARQKLITIWPKSQSNQLRKVQTWLWSMEMFPPLCADVDNRATNPSAMERIERCISRQKRQKSKWWSRPPSQVIRHIAGGILKEHFNRFIHSKAGATTRYPV